MKVITAAVKNIYSKIDISCKPNGKKNSKYFNDKCC